MPDRAFNKHTAGPVRWMTVGVAAYLGWLLANILLGLLFPFLILIELTGGRAGMRVLRRFGVWFLRVFFLGYFSLIRVYKVRELPDPKRLVDLAPCVFIVNHRSWIDPLLLCALIPNVRIPVNIGYTKVPLAGRAMGWLGCIPLNRNSRESISAGFGEIRGALNEGSPVAVFPEGTRYPVGRVGQFSDFIFKVAIEADMPVVPLILHLDQPFLGPERTYLTPRCAALKIQLLDEIKPRRGDRSVDLRRMVHKQMKRKLDKLDAQGAPKKRGRDERG